MKTNTHNSNLTTSDIVPQATKAALAQYDRILLGIDQHATDLRVVRQLDGAGCQPPQRIYPGGGGCSEWSGGMNYRQLPPKFTREYNAAHDSEGESEYWISR